jgi:putative ABC transport system permease protein
MPFHEILKQTLSALWETKLRSFLTMFGIVWGITSVILLVGLGIGFNVFCCGSFHYPTSFPIPSSHH